MVKEILKGDVDIKYVPTKNVLHYEISPYVFNPKTASRIVGKHYLDLGQGILDLLKDIHRQYVVPKDDILPEAPRVKQSVSVRS